MASVPQDEPVPKDELDPPTGKLQTLKKFQGRFYDKSVFDKKCDDNESWELWEQERSRVLLHERLEDYIINPDRLFKMVLAVPKINPELPRAKRFVDKLKALKRLGEFLTARPYKSFAMVADIMVLIILRKVENGCVIVNDNFNVKRERALGPEYPAVCGAGGFGLGIHIASKTDVNLLKELGPQLRMCKQNKEKIICMPLTLKGHANLLIYRPELQVIERFEPHGRGLNNDTTGEEEVHYNKVLKTMFEVDLKPYIGDVKYRDPSQVMSECNEKWGGFQYYEELHDIRDGHYWEQKGKCEMWMLFMMEMVLLNPQRTTESIIRDSLIYTKRNPKYLKDLIQGYILTVEREVDELIESLRLEKKLIPKREGRAPRFKYKKDTQFYIDHHLKEVLKLDLDRLSHWFRNTVIGNYEDEPLKSSSNPCSSSSSSSSPSSSSSSSSSSSAPPKRVLDGYDISSAEEPSPSAAEEPAAAEEPSTKRKKKKKSDPLYGLSGKIRSV